MYFNKLPKTEHTFTYESETGTKNITLPVVDIFRRVSFTKSSKNNQDNYELYTISNGERPEDVAANVYGDANLWWLVLLFNDVIDPFNEWVFDSSALNDRLDSYYGGSSFYFTEQINAKVNDILIKRDTSIEGGIDIDSYGFIGEYDALTHRVDIRTGKTVGTLNENDEVYIFRKKTDGKYESVGDWGSTGCYPSFAGNTFCNEIAAPLDQEDDEPWTAPLCATAGSTFGIIQKKVNILESAAEFLDSVGNPISPYSGITGIASGVNEPYGDFYRIGNICGLTSCVLYRYINDDLPSTIKVKNKTAGIIEQNDERRSIKILKISALSRVLAEITAMLRGTTVPRGTVEFIKYN
tara:strand:+ start:2620 stop:3678 length:1059 start_codon:yes stop_codon:yes gene_type:complete